MFNTFHELQEDYSFNYLLNKPLNNTYVSMPSSGDIKINSIKEFLDKCFTDESKTLEDKLDAYLHSALHRRIPEDEKATWCALVMREIFLIICADTFIGNTVDINVKLSKQITTTIANNQTKKTDLVKFESHAVVLNKYALTLLVLDNVNTDEKTMAHATIELHLCLDNNNRSPLKNLKSDLLNTKIGANCYLCKANPDNVTRLLNGGKNVMFESAVGSDIYLTELKASTISQLIAESIEKYKR